MLHSWLSQAPVEAAFITASITLLGIVLKDILFKYWDERRAESRAEVAVFERYSKPLSVAASSLLTRMYEILLQPHRPVYLNCVGIPNGLSHGARYRAYKKLSTIYRLASLMGWLRACRREFSYVRVAPKHEVSFIQDSISQFESALSDGSWVERERVHRLNDLWKFGLGTRLEGSTLDKIGVVVDNAIWDNLDHFRREDCEDLSSDQRRSMCQNIADIITDLLRVSKTGSEVVDVTWPEAFKILSIREAWIYRDWQDAIGDLMIKTNEDKDRKFDVRGYGEFEELVRSGTQEQGISRISEMFEKVDLSIEDHFDARPRQLRTLLLATAKLVQALHRAQGENSIVAEHALAIASKVLAELG